MIRSYVFSAVAGIAALGCGAPCPCRDAPKVQTQPCPLPVATSSSVPAEAGASPVGIWESTSCGSRTYARTLEIRADQTFTAEDFVSPCPAGAQCVWSGIETRKGEWQRGAKLILLREDPNGAKMRATFPLELEWDGRLREGACEYTRATKAKE